MKKRLFLKQFFNLYCLVNQHRRWFQENSQVNSQESLMLLKTRTLSLTEQLAERLAERETDNVVMYLSTAPSLFTTVCEQLAANGLNTAKTRIVLEKPLGGDAEKWKDSLRATGMRNGSLPPHPWTRSSSWPSATRSMRPRRKLPSSSVRVSALAAAARWRSAAAGAAAPGAAAAPAVAAPAEQAPRARRTRPRSVPRGHRGPGSPEADDAGACGSPGLPPGQDAWQVQRRRHGDHGPPAGDRGGLRALQEGLDG